MLDQNERVHVSQIHAINLNEETFNWKKKHSTELKEVENVPPFTFALTEDCRILN